MRGSVERERGPRLCILREERLVGRGWAWQKS